MSLYQTRHYKDIAELLGRLWLPDQAVQILTEEFGSHFQNDSDNFDFKQFQSYVTRMREGR